MASLKKKLKKAGKKIQKAAKSAGRQVQKVGAKVVKYATPVLAGVGTVLFGPAVGAGITAAGSIGVRGMAATGARAEGKKGKKARTKGRKEMQKTLKMGLAATGAGMAGGGLIAGLGGGNILGGVLGGTQNIFGIGGGGRAGAEAAGEEGWEEGGLLSQLYGSGANVTGTAAEAAGTPGFDWGGFIGKTGAGLFAPKEAGAPSTGEQGEGGGFFQNLFSTTPGEGVSVPLLGELPMGVVLIGGGLALWAVAKK